MFQIVFTLFLMLSTLYSSECITCHKKEAESFKHSIHYTLKKAINITRKTWGINESNVTLQTLPLPKKEIHSPKDLVDDFLRRKCLKCHVDTKKSNGCLACHNEHQGKGTYYKAKTSMDKCLNCHNKEYTGGEFTGMFPKDFEKSYRAPLTKKGYFPPTKYGIDYHRLSEDIHYKIGLKCSDCHKNLHLDSKKASCTDCHKKPSIKNHPTYHKNIDCIACHASWQINSYELSVFRDDTPNYKQWKRLTLQEDTYLHNFLTKALKEKIKPVPMMPDWVNRKLKRGIWYSGYRYRRWEDFYLANDKDGKIKLFRPLYQYRISFRDKDGIMVLDDVDKLGSKKIEVWLQYYPHTIGKYAKTCEMCHNNPLILQQKKSNKNLASDLKLPNHLHNATPLTKEQIQKFHSKRYKKIRAKLLF